MSNELTDLTKVVEQLDPDTLTAKDMDTVFNWARDKIAFVLVDMTTQKILAATPGAEETFQYMPDEMIGLDLVELIPEEFRTAHAKYVNTFNQAPQQRSMGRLNIPLVGRQRDGKTFPVEIALYPRQFKGKRICVANIVRLSKEI